MQVARWRRGAAVLLFSVALYLLLHQLLRWMHRGEFFNADSPMLYSAATLSFDYIEFGAVRRGLASTLIYLLHPNRMVGTAIFWTLSAVALCALVAILFDRTRTRPLQQAFMAWILICLAHRWGQDTGRADLAVVAVLSLATLLVTRGRIAWAGALVVSGIFIHETSVIYGLPLLAALLLHDRRYARLSTRDWRRFALGLGLPILAYVGLGLMPHAPNAVMVQTVREALSSHKYVNWAIYFAVSGWRGVETSLCQNRIDPNYPVHVLSAVLILSVCVFVMAGSRRRTTALALVASVPPLIFLSIVANDFTRWTEFSAFNAWLLCAVHFGRSGSDRVDEIDEIDEVDEVDEVDEPDRAIDFLRVVAAALAFFLVADTTTYPVAELFYAPSTVIEHWVKRRGGPETPNLDIVLQRCDPGWLDFLDGVKPAASR